MQVVVVRALLTGLLCKLGKRQTSPAQALQILGAGLDLCRRGNGHSGARLRARPDQEAAGRARDDPEEDVHQVDELVSGAGE